MSYATGQSTIMRYGRDPYRGLGASPEQVACEVGGGRWVAEGSTVRCEGGTRELVETTIIETVRTALPPVVMIGTGIVAGAAGGLAGGLLGKAGLGVLIGAVGGGILGWMGWQSLARAPVAPPNDVAGLSGMLAVV